VPTPDHQDYAASFTAIAAFQAGLAQLVGIIRSAAYCTVCRRRHTVHKVSNVLNKVALSVQVNMKADLREIYGAPTRAAAEAAIDVFAKKYEAKYDRAVVCLTKDRQCPAYILRLPSRALGSSSHVKPDRERVCDSSAPNRADQGISVGNHRQAHGVQAGHRGGENLATIAR
jgi:putative transposase